MYNITLEQTYCPERRAIRCTLSCEINGDTHFRNYYLDERLNNDEQENHFKANYFMLVADIERRIKGADSVKLHGTESRPLLSMGECGDSGEGKRNP